MASPEPPPAYKEHKTPPPTPQSPSSKQLKKSEKQIDKSEVQLKEAVERANASRTGIPYTLNLRPISLAAAILLITAAALGSYSSQLTLGPVYGDIPTSLYHEKICAAIFAVVWFSRPLLLRIFPKPLLLLSILAFYVPVIQRSLFKYSAQWGASKGPIYTMALSYYWTLIWAVLCASVLLQTPSFVLDIIPAGLSWVLFKGVRNYLPRFLFHRMGSNWLFTRCGLAHLTAFIYSIISPSALLLFAAPAWYHSSQLNPACSNAAAVKYLNATLAASNFTVLARAESATGFISVMENSFQNYRVMRCDHSLLGGEWLKPPPGAHIQEYEIKEPIYPVFVTLEAVRLVRPSPKASKPKALMIGLGIGTSQSGLMRHGVETHIVEIDPIVYRFSKEFFGLLPDHTEYITDAVRFVKNEAAAEQPKQYDFIIHDVFTGGAAPASLLTAEMLTGMHKLLADDGVVAINYAGDLRLKPAKMVIETARTIFGHCKVYREDPPNTNDDKDEDFTNMVIFCTKQDKPFRFKDPQPEDYLGSYARFEFLVPKYMVDLEALFGKDGNGNPLHAEVLDSKTIKEFENMQRASAVNHWKIMRTVMPAESWENY